ncbi:cell division protein FtsW, partial [Candidatus Uhrbacteria bacterium]|nr:cell division protein FtsW [Candidatus Uhrbacteria bacterium]
MRFRSERKKIDGIFLILVLALVGFGLMMLSSAAGPLGYARFGDTLYFVKHQALYGILPGLAVLLVMMKIPYGWWKRMAAPLLVISLVLLALVFIPGIRAEFGTARSWVRFGFFSFQPSEIVKLTFLFYLAAWFESRGEGGVRRWRTGFLPFLGVLGLIVALLLRQPDTGSMAVIALEALAVFFVAGSSLTHLVLTGGAGLVLLGILLKLSPYRAARFMTFLHPELDPQGIGYHINQALLALGSGGIFGLGYGHSRQKFQYLPEVYGDSIFAVIGEELGLFFSLLIVFGFLALFFRSVRIAQNAPDPFAKYFAIGVGAWFTIQAFVNIASMIALLPITGVTLPFVSYGG